MLATVTAAAVGTEAAAAAAAAAVGTVTGSGTFRFTGEVLVALFTSSFAGQYGLAAALYELLRLYSSTRVVGGGRSSAEVSGSPEKTAGATKEVDIVGATAEETETAFLRDFLED